MEIYSISKRRRSLALVFPLLIGLPIIERLTKLVSPNGFDVKAYFSFYSISQLHELGLSEDMAKLVTGSQEELFKHTFADFAEMTVWIRKKIDKEFRLQQLIVYNRCIVSHTELTLLVAKFPYTMTSSFNREP
jgi:hypothetical protein